MRGYPLVETLSPPFPVGKPTREAYGEALVEIARKDPRVVALDADLSKSTKSAYLGKVFPERFFNMGICEANMVSAAAGLSASGYQPWVSSFACFLTSKGFDQMRISVGLPGFDVKFVGSHGGISVGEDGPSQHAIEDISLMCSLPGFTVVVPADEVETRLAVEALWRLEGPAYLRTCRPKAPRVYKDRFPFQLGRANLLREGEDVTILALGLEVAEALEAEARLREEGIACRVLDMHTVKPVDREAISRSALETGALVVAEEHQIYGGLGSIVARVVAETYPVPVEFVAIRDTYAESGKPRELFRKYGLDAEAILRAVRRVVDRKARRQRKTFLGVKVHD